MSRNAPSSWGRTFRDIPNNGCGGDLASPMKQQHFVVTCHIAVYCARHLSHRRLLKRCAFYHIKVCVLSFSDETPHSSTFFFLQAVSAASKSAEMRRECERSQTVDVDDVVVEESLSSSEGDDEFIVWLKVPITPKFFFLAQLNCVI